MDSRKILPLGNCGSPIITVSYCMKTWVTLCLFNHESKKHTFVSRAEYISPRQPSTAYVSRIVSSMRRCSSVNNARPLEAYPEREKVCDSNFIRVRVG